MSMVLNTIPQAARKEIPRAVRCIYCRNPAVCIPAMVVPVKNWHQDAYLLVRDPDTNEVRGVCDTHKLTFDLSKFTDYYGSWYDMVRAHVEEYQRKVEDPVTGIVTMCRGGYKVGEMKDCRLEYWRVERQRPRLLPMWRS